jgi:transcriptional regulator with XRE-family HTH domain
MPKKFLEELQKKGMTQKQIADRAGTAQQVISKILNGKKCTLETAIKLANAFGASLDEVVGRTTPKKKPISNSIRDNAKGRKLKSEL